MAFIQPGIFLSEMQAWLIHKRACTGQQMAEHGFANAAGSALQLGHCASFCVWVIPQTACSDIQVARHMPGPDATLPVAVARMKPEHFTMAVLLLQAA